METCSYAECVCIFVYHFFHAQVCLHTHVDSIFRTRTYIHTYNLIQRDLVVPAHFLCMFSSPKHIHASPHTYNHIQPNLVLRILDSKPVRLRVGTKLIRHCRSHHSIRVHIQKSVGLDREASVGLHGKKSIGDLNASRCCCICYAVGRHRYKSVGHLLRGLLRWF